MERRPELSTKVELARRAPPPVACYLIVLLARHDAPSWSRFLLFPSPLYSLSSLLSAAAPLYGLLSCFVIGISLPLYLSFNISLHRAPDPLLSPFSRRFNSCSFHCTLGEPPNSPVNRPREATIVKPSPPSSSSSSSKYCGILSARCFVATATSAHRYKAMVFL